MIVRMQYNYFHNMEGLVITESDQKAGHIIIPRRYETEPVIGIAPEVFRRCKEITELTLQPRFEMIDSYAFADCWNLRVVRLPDTLKRICCGAFSNCVSLESIALPRKTELDNSVFAGCEKLKTVTMPENLESIGANMFADCASLEEVIVPNSVRYIWENAFKNCLSLRRVVLSDAIENIDRDAFRGCSSLEIVIGVDSFGVGEMLRTECGVRRIRHK